MKKLLGSVPVMMLLALLLVGTTKKEARAQDVTVSFQTFYDELAPYGTWVNDPSYGTVWVPNEGGDFRPYGSRGYWAMTEYGNTWMSEDPWGWACYHYGRWTYDPYYGWLWIPGYEWAPAWVSWRYGGGYCGWAPMGPGVSVGMAFNYPESWWIFIQPRYMYDRNCVHYWRGPSYNTTYIRQTTIINNYYVDNRTHVRYNYGPRREVLQRDLGHPVQVYRVNRMSRPGAPVIERNSVNIYRPMVNRGTQQSARPQNVVQAPRRIGAPQPANNMNAGRQPEFRQQMQRSEPVRQQPQPQMQRTEPVRQQPQPQMQRPEPVRQQPQPQMQRTEPMRQQPQPQPQRPEPMRQQPQPQRQRPEPMRQPQPPMQRPEPMRQQPQRQEPMRQERPEPMQRGNR